MNLQQAQLALSTKILTDEQKKQILVQAGLKASEDAIQAELLETTLKQAGVSAEKRKTILDTLGLMNAEGTEVIAQKTCTKADLEAILAQELKNKTDERGILTTLGLGEANLFTAETFKLMGKQALIALKTIATNPITWIVAGAVAIAAVTEAITDTTKEIEERLEETKNKIQETESKISSIKQQIDANTQKLEEMREAGMDESTLRVYEKENEELNSQLQLLKDINEETKKKKAPDAAKIVNNEGKQTAIGKAFNQLKSGDILGLGGTLLTEGIGLVSVVKNIATGEYSKSGGGTKIVKDAMKVVPGVGTVASYLTPTSDSSKDIVSITNEAIENYKKYKEEFDSLKESDFNSKKEFWDKQQEISEKIGSSSSVIGENISKLLEYRKELSELDKRGRTFFVNFHSIKGVVAYCDNAFLSFILPSPYNRFLSASSPFP
ncbi:MAG: hypothetical protein E7403_02195 [Ruminococcaceae bacterium]|nr:hypothetical protein [Oscillospiraceae bacterium]